MKEMNMRLLFFLTILNLSNALGQTNILVPHGIPVMIDGDFTGKEWNDGKVITIQDSIKLFFKQTEEFVFIGIEPPKKGYNGGWIDLYLSEGENNIFNLHASRKLGERKLTNGKWEDWDKWWTNKGKWKANYIRPDDIEENGKTKAIQLKDDGWEYQIRKDKFGKGNWRILFEISIVLNGFKNIKYPNELTTEAKNWLVLTFEQ